MARPGRFERPTSGSGDQRSIQLSYGRAVGAPSYRDRRSAQRASSSYSISSDLLAPAHILPVPWLRQTVMPTIQSPETEFPSPTFRFLPLSWASPQKALGRNLFFPLRL